MQKHVDLFNILIINIYRIKLLNKKFKLKIKNKKQNN